MLARDSSHRASIIRLCLCCAAALPLAGCGGEDNGILVPVSGKVICNGEPLTKGEINFIPEQSSSRGAHGTIGPAGRYTLSSYGVNDGAHPGKYKVTVIARGEDMAIPEKQRGSMMEEDMQGSGKFLVPTKYTSPVTTDLNAHVTDAGGQEFEFTLTGEVTGEPEKRARSRGRR